jgi:transcriptional regulator with XRE-family HTH domain
MIDKYATGDKLQALIKERGYSQLRLAVEANLTPCAISHICAGRTGGGVRLETAYRISRVLGVNLDDWVVLNDGAAIEQ